MSSYLTQGFQASLVISATRTTQDGGFALAAVGVDRASTAPGADVPQVGFPSPLTAFLDQEEA